MSSSVYVQSLKEYLSEILHCEATLMAFEQFLNNQYYTLKKDYQPSKCCHENSLYEYICEKDGYIVSRFYKYKAIIDKMDMEEAERVKQHRKLQLQKAIKEKMETGGDPYGRNKVNLKAALSKLKVDFEWIYNLDSLSVKQLEELDRIGNKNRTIEGLDKLRRDPAYCLYKEIKETLPKLYSINIIHPKYHNITAIASIYDYFDTGITYSLARAESGSDPGAYHLYNEDIKANKIINVINIGFNSISSQLSTIQENQYHLYLTIRESNKISQRLSSELQGISNELCTTNNALQKNSYELMQSNIINEETARNSRILVDINRDRWGDLRNRDGRIIP